MSIAPRTVLGPYEVVSLLGSGGMGEVYRARDTKLEREVAIKILRERFTHDPERLARFQREARVLAALNHPHIAAIYGLEASNGTHYLVLELVDGESLDKRIARGPIPVDEAMAIAQQIAEALEAAHEKGIIHRDLKPANIALTRDGKVKVLDFGLAKAVETTTSGSFDAISSPTITSPAMMTGVGTLLGTAAYMAPEQAKGRAADRRSDIWAFGCVLYEMLTGRRAFEGSDVTDTLAFILTREPDWSALPANTPASVRRLLRRCLQKDRSRRFESASDSRLEIDDAISAGPGEAGSPNRAGYGVAWISATVVGLIVGALAGAWAVSRFVQPRSDERILRVPLDPPQNGRFVLGGSMLGDFAISPDGKTVVYSASVDGKAGLWIRPLDSISARLLPGTEYSGQPFWSPDGRSIGFVNLGTTMRVVDPSGGTPLTLCSSYGMRGGSWNSDGSILFSALISGRDGLFRIAASGGTPELVTAPDESRGELRYRWPLGLPDGRFLFTVEGANDHLNGVYAASLHNPTEHVKLLTTAGRAVYAAGPDGNGFLFWTQGGTLMARRFEPRTLQFAGQPHVIADSLNPTAESDMHLSASNGLLLYGFSRDAMQLAWFDRAGKQLTQVGEPLSYVSMFRLSPDERHIAVQQQMVRSGSTGVSNLWLVDAERGLGRRFTASAVGHDTQPVWSPDGRTILFTHLGSPEIVRKSASGVGDEQLAVRRPGEVLPTDWSQDGQWVLTRERGADTGFDIWKIPVTPDGTPKAGAAPSPYVRTRFNELGARFSPDPHPRWVAYSSDESGRSEVYVDSFPEPRGAIRISTGGGLHPKWGVAGHELFYVSPDNILMTVVLRMTPDTIEPSTPGELFRLPLRSSAGATYEPSSDGQRFLVLTTPESAPPSLTMIVNWPALLKKGAAAP